MTSKNMRAHEKLLVMLDDRPWDALYRVAIGFSTVAIFWRVYGRSGSGRALALFLLGVLSLLRIVPAILRKLVPFSDAAQATWNSRRQMAKHYDSYQWQKLFWIGLGLAMHVVIFRGVSTGQIILASICLLSGLVGLVVWSARRDRGTSASSRVRQLPQQTLSPEPERKS